MPPPTPAAIRAVLRRHGLTGSQAARAAYLSGGQSVRKYTGGAAPHTMSGAVWFALHAHVMLPPETVAEIEAAMAADTQEEAT
jgi:hypothetical protein